MVETWKKLTSENVSEIIDVDEHDDESLEMLKPGMRPEEYIGELSSAGIWSEAAMVMSRTLPKREAVWWACVCASKTEAVSKDEDEALALQVAENWAFKPSEENRRDAFLQAQKSESPSIGTMACLAVAFTESELSLSEGQSIDLDSSVFSQIVSGIVLIAAGEKEPEQFDAAVEQFLKQGKDIACGRPGKPKA